MVISALNAFVFFWKERKKEKKMQWLTNGDRPQTDWALYHLGILHNLDGHNS